MPNTGLFVCFMSCDYIVNSLFIEVSFEGQVLIWGKLARGLD